MSFVPCGTPACMCFQEDETLLNNLAVNWQTCESGIIITMKPYLRLEMIQMYSIFVRTEQSMHVRHKQQMKMKLFMKSMWEICYFFHSLFTHALKLPECDSDSKRYSPLRGSTKV